ncbi:response regulator transcription factor [Anaerovorax odorimutans]|uniref:Stage 0 sporulation protein A homolog n=1 Tax=Anaerovorax odorimutans TaxID=109327 RepID=A0ABT1RN91_9FIRM|nr:response regulator transcription factor [Anaerovorax odorimutans]MCQ4636638.1 response regulator transcription factor [Anaerovorax odorimutans]
MAKILLLEDDKVLSKGIQITLEKSGHTVIPAFTFFDGAAACATQTFDLFLLDIGLPDGNGMDFCRKLRTSSDNPILFLTANDTEADMLEGFSAGCDDYIAKPFSIKVLRHKIEAMLRRSSAENVPSNRFCYKDLIIDFDRMNVQKNGRDCRLTATEYRLLEYMAKNRGKVLTRSMLLSRLWDMDGNFIDENTLSVHVGRLRRKLETDPKNPQYIITVFGIGYTFGE